MEASEVWEGSQGSLLMSGQIRSASHADCRVTEECHVPADVELMELGPLLEENGPIGAKGLQSEASYAIINLNTLQSLSYSIPDSKKYHRVVFLSSDCVRRGQALSLMMKRRMKKSEKF